MEEVDSSFLEWLWGIHDVSRGSNWSCGKNSNEIRIRSGTQRCDWIAKISWGNFSEWAVAFYEWLKKKWFLEM